MQKKIVKTMAAAALSLGLAAGFASTALAASSDNICQMVADRISEQQGELVYVELDRAFAKVSADAPVALHAALSSSYIAEKLGIHDITWCSSDESIASVDANGTVQARGTGEAVITATASNGNSAQCLVTSLASPYDGASAIPVLTYHRIASDFAKLACYDDTSLAISRSDFEDQLAWLAENGYTTISTHELHEWMAGKICLPRKSVLVTIDDGLYETYHVAYPVLRKMGMKACVFVIGDSIPDETDAYVPASEANHYMGWDAIAEMRHDYPGFEVQSHSYGLHKRQGDGMGVACSMGADELTADTALMSGDGFTAMAYPFGHTTWLFESVLSQGGEFEMAFGYPMNEPVTRSSDMYDIPRYKVFGDGTMAEFIAMASSGY